MGSRHRALGKQGEENRRREVPRSPVSAGAQTVNHSSLIKSAELLTCLNEEGKCAVVEKVESV